MYRSIRSKGFTLVEILIVVIILGILAAIVIPQFTNASTDARKNSLSSQLQTLRSQIELYKLQHNDAAPLFTGSNADAQWEQMTLKTDVSGATTGTDFGPYLQQNPSNPLNSNTEIINITGADPVFGGAAPPTTTGATGLTGFVFNRDSGKIWATNQNTGSFYDEVTGILVP
jgi:general secretion pathway protein G